MYSNEEDQKYNWIIRLTSKEATSHIDCNLKTTLKMKDKKQESNMYTSDTLPLNMAMPNINELMKTSDANEDSMLSSSILKQDSMQETKFEVKESQP